MNFLSISHFLRTNSTRPPPPLTSLHRYVADTTLAHNTIHNSAYTAICAGWGWGMSSYVRNIKIMNNSISKPMQLLYDGGGVYTNTPCFDCHVSGNYFSGDPHKYGCLYVFVLRPARLPAHAPLSHTRTSSRTPLHPSCVSLPLPPLFLPLTPPRCLTDTTTVAPDFGPTERMSLTISGRRASSAMGRAQELALIMCGTTTARNLICKGTRTTSFATQLLGTVRTRQSLILVEETGQRRRRPSLTAQDDALRFLDLNHRRSRHRSQNPRRRRLVMRRAGTHPLLHLDRKDLRQRYAVRRNSRSGGFYRQALPRARSRSRRI